MQIPNSLAFNSFDSDKGVSLIDLQKILVLPEKMMKFLIATKCVMH